MGFLSGWQGRNVCRLKGVCCFWQPTPGKHRPAKPFGKSGLNTFGICYEDYQKGGAWIFENGVPTLYLSGKEYSQKYPIKDGEIYVKSELHNEDREDTELILNGKNYSFVENGLNILIKAVFRQVFPVRKG